MKPTPFHTCPMFGDECRHCSIERTFGSCTKIAIDPKTQLFVSKGIEAVAMRRGEYCNSGVVGLQTSTIAQQGGV